MAFTLLLLVWKPTNTFPWWGVLALPCGTKFQSGELHKCHHCHQAQTQRCMYPCVKNKMFEEQKPVLFSLFLVNWASLLKISPMDFHIISYFLPQWWFGSRNALPRFVPFSLSWKNISVYRHFSTGIYVSKSQNSRYYSETLFNKCGVECNMKS